MSKSKIIQQIENEQMNKELPTFGPGDTVVVQVRIQEGDRERLQAFEGVVIAAQPRLEIFLYSKKNFSRRRCRACIPGV